MGTTAFALTMASEAGLSVILSGPGLANWASVLATPVGLVGLVGQIAFGLTPMFVERGRAPA